MPYPNEKAIMARLQSDGPLPASMKVLDPFFDYAYVEIICRRDEFHSRSHSYLIADEILLFSFAQFWSLQRSRLQRRWRKWRRSRRRYRRLRQNEGHVDHTCHSLLDCTKFLGCRLGPQRLFPDKARRQHVQHRVMGCLRQNCLRILFRNAYTFFFAHILSRIKLTRDALSNVVFTTADTYFFRAIKWNLCQYINDLIS